ncbi:MAG: NifB/NifX family molybdenum-iron cluster-binding protein [Dissulfurispiraceae bacterium]
MKLCFPVQMDQGLDSKVYNHFGSAPLFLVVDTASDIVTPVYNRDEHHAHGACNPIMALKGQKVDAIIVGGIGAGALSTLNQSGIKVFKAAGSTIKENLELLKTHSVAELTLQHTCEGHSEGGGCSH